MVSSELINRLLSRWLLFVKVLSLGPQKECLCLAESDGERFYVLSFEIGSENLSLLNFSIKLANETNISHVLKYGMKFYR